LAKAAELDSILMEAGIQSAIAGPAAWALRTQAPPIREITYLMILVPRAQVGAAWETLANAGWEARNNLPSGQEWDWCGHANFWQKDLRLSLAWRLIPVGPRMPWNASGRFSCESTESPGTSIVCGLLRQKRLCCTSWVPSEAATCPGRRTWHSSG
jgi:hypothetical protein